MERNGLLMELLKKNVVVSELKQKNSSIAYIDGDIIVPDIKPDILKILQVDAISRIDEKEIYNGEIRIRGTVKYNILYVPESENENIKAITSEMEFSCSVDKFDQTERIMPKIFADVEKVEFNLINSRKLNIKTAVAVDYIFFGEKELEIADSVDIDDMEIICEKVSAGKINILEKRKFLIRDILEIPAGVSGISEILKMDISISDREIKAITGKAVVKGNVGVCALYLDMEKNIHSIDGEIPFTEVLEIDELEEDAFCNIEYRLGEFGQKIALDDDGEARRVEFDISIIAMVTSEDAEEFEIISDCFFPGKPAKIISDRVEFERMVLTQTDRHTIKDVISADGKSPQIASVYNVVARPVIIKSQCEKGRAVLEGRCEIYALYITDNSQVPVHCIKKDVPINIKIENERISPEMNCYFRLNSEHIAYNLNMANEVEVRCLISCEVLVTEKFSLSVVGGVELEEKEKECAIVIYFVKSGDTLWNIAKRYSVSIDAISELNKIEDKNSIKPGDRLIIPVC